MSNKHFDNGKFMLVKVKYTDKQTAKYTYAALISDKLETNDFVVVPVGKGSGVDSMQIAQVGATTEDMTHLPDDYAIKPIICKVQSGNYDKVMKWLEGK